MLLSRSLLLLAAAQMGAQTAHHGAHGHDETQAHGHAGHESPDIDGAHIVVTINPEARVSAVKGKRLPQVQCGQSLPIQVAIVNQGFVTARLQALLVGDSARQVALEHAAPRLTGQKMERLEMRLTSIGSNPADVTIAFSISQEIGDLNSRDRVHLLVACRRT